MKTNFLYTFFLFVVTAGLVAGLTTAAHADTTPIVLNAWNTNGNSGITADGWQATTVAANMQTGQLSRGAGLTATSLANGFAASGWDVASLEASKTEGTYFEFYVEPSAGFLLNLSGVQFNTRRSGTGPNALQLSYSTNGVDFTDVGSAITGYTNTTDGFAHPTIDLSTVTALQDVGGRVTFRLYGWGASASTGTLSIGRTGAESNDLTITGTTISAGGPVLTTNLTSLSGFSYVEGFGPSGVQTFTLSGENLSGSNVVVEAPTGFQVAGSVIEGFVGSTTLTAYDGATQSFQVRMASGLATGTYSGNITISGGGVESEITVAVSGVVGPSLLAVASPYTQNFNEFTGIMGQAVAPSQLPLGWTLDKENFLYRGDFTSGTTTGGVYGNGALGIVMTGTAPNTELIATLTLGNGTGSTIENLLISYDGLVSRTDVNGTPSWTVKVNGEPVSGLAFSTADGSDASLSAYATGLSIENGTSFTVSWHTERQGTAAQRKIGFTNVSVQAVDELPLLPPVFSVAAGTYFADQTVFVSNFAEYASSVEVRFTTDGSEPTASSTLYDNTTGIQLTDGAGPITLRAVAIDGAESTDIVTAVYTFPFNLSSISEFRALGSEDVGTLYRITSTAFFTAGDGFRNTKFFQDVSRVGIQIDDPNPAKITTSYNPGDAVGSLIGTLEIFEGQHQLRAAVDFGAPISTGATIQPVVRTLSSITAADQSRLIVIGAVEFAAADGVATFGGGGSVTAITDPSLESGTFRYRNIFGDSNITGSILPQGPQNITGIIQVNSDGLNFAARSLADIEDATVSLTITGSAGWRMLSAPVPGMPLSVFDGKAGIQGFDNDGFARNLFTGYDGTDWTPAGNPATPRPTTVNSGQGFLLYIYDNDQAGSTPIGSGMTITAAGLPLTDNASLSVHQNGEHKLNFLGNPFREPIDITQLVGTADFKPNVLVWDSEINDWLNSADELTLNGVIAPWQGFILGNIDSDFITIPVASQTTGGTFYRENRNWSQLQFVLSSVDGDEVQVRDRSAIVQLREEQDLARHEMPKMAPLSSPSAMLYFTENVEGVSQAMGQVARPRAIADRIEIPFEIVSYQAGAHFRVEWPVLRDLPEGVDFFVVDTHYGEVYPMEPGGYADVVVYNVSMAKGEGLMSAYSQNVNTSGARFLLVGERATTTSTEAASDLPTELVLAQNYPNPFNPTSRIDYQLPEASHVRLSVFDLLGREVAVLVNESMNAGSHFVNIDASNLSSGVYIYRLQAGGQVITRKMTLVK